MCLMQRAYAALYSSAIIIQSNVRGFTIRQRFLHRKEDKAATIIQVLNHEMGMYYGVGVTFKMSKQWPLH